MNLESREIVGEQETRKRFLDSLEGAAPRIGDSAHRDRQDTAALRGSYQVLYDNIPLMCFTLDASGGVLAVNSYSVEQLGYQREELIGQPVSKVFHPEDQPAVKEQLEGVLKDPGRVARWRHRKIRRDGSVLWVQETARAVQEGARTVVLVVCEDVTDDVESDRELLRYQKELRALTSELALAEERERRRIGEGLHDQIGQALAMAKLWLGTLQETGDAAARMATLGEIRGLLDGALKETRTLSFELSCPILYRLGLEAALSDIGERVFSKTAIRFCFDSDSLPMPLAEDTQVILYRIARELLVNITKHARARAARLGLSRVGDDVRITVEDDGIGIEDSAPGHQGPSRNGGLGLFNIRERLEHLGGRFRIEPMPEGGTRISVVAPIDGGIERGGRTRDGDPDSDRGRS